MTQGLNKLDHLKALVRLDFVLALISGQWLMTIMAFYVEPEPRQSPALIGLGLFLSLVLSTLVAGGLGVFVLALNDVLDARHDRAFAPGRPIPSGRVSQRVALSVAMTGLLIGIAAAVPFGPISVELALVTAGAMVFYNVAGRFVPAVGVVTLGLVIGLMMAIPNPKLTFAWPILLTMTHVTAAATFRYLLAGKRPRLTPIHGWLICVGWAFWVLVMIVLIRLRDDDALRDQLGLVWVGPAAAMLVLLMIVWLMLGPSALNAKARRGTAARFTKLAAAWLIVFHTAWLWSAGLWWQGMLVLTLLMLAGIFAPTAPVVRAEQSMGRTVAG